MPKPFLAVAGRPFIEWPLAVLARAGVRQFVLALGHQASQAEAYLHQRPPDGLAVTAVAEPEPLGTAGAALYAAAACPTADPLLIANADSVLVADLRDLWTMVRPGAVDGVIVAIEVPDTARYGRLEVDPDGFLLAHRQGLPGAGLVSAGIYLLQRQLLGLAPGRRPLSFETDLFPDWARRGIRLRVHQIRAPFIDIGVPESFERAEAFVRTHLSGLRAS
jgi:NDP-sugar pyrophosphorylase family protein